MVRIKRRQTHAVTDAPSPRQIRRRRRARAALAYLTKLAIALVIVYYIVAPLVGHFGFNKPENWSEALLGIVVGIALINLPPWAWQTWRRHRKP
jgi:hypothetical protein